MDVGSKVQWERGALPPGNGVVSQIKAVEGINVCMVRDALNNLYAFPESKLTEVVTP